MENKDSLLLVKSHAKAVADFSPILTDYSPMIVSHPFTKSGIVPYKSSDDNSSFEYLDITTSRENLKVWQQMTKDIIDSCNSIEEVFTLVDPNYRLFFLGIIKNSVSKQMFSKLLADAYTNTEFPNSNPNVTKAEMIKMFKYADKETLMGENDYEVYSKMKTPIKIYRGTSSAKKEHINALSWTLSKKVAEKFANRYFCTGYVFEAEIDKKNILAFFSNMQEAEVIVEPSQLKNIKQINADEPEKE